MEGAAEEPLPLLTAVFQRTVGGAWWHAYLVRHILYAVFISAVVGRADVVCLVVATDVACQANLPYRQPLGDTDAHTRCPLAADEYGYGLLDLYAEVTRTLLYLYHWHDSGSGPVVGLQMYS